MGMTIRIDRCLNQHVLVVTAPGGKRYRLEEVHDSAVVALVPPAKGAKVADYERRGVQVALVTHAKDDGKGEPLTWQALGECAAADVVIACGLGTVVT